MWCKNCTSDNPFINSIITDALTSLIELESSQTEDEYYSAIRLLLDTPDDTMAQELAYGYYVYQFDHPTDASEVYLAIDSLNADEKGNFLVMAGKAMKDYAFFADLLLNELCILLPPKAELVFRKYCHPPDPPGHLVSTRGCEVLVGRSWFGSVAGGVPEIWSPIRNF